MARGTITASGQDTFTGNGTGQTFAAPQLTSPGFSRWRHVVSKWTSSGGVTGAVLTYDVQTPDNVWIDSGQPGMSVVGSDSGVFDGIVSSITTKAVRTRISGWTGGTSTTVVTSLVDAI